MNEMIKKGYDNACSTGREVVRYAGQAAEFVTDEISATSTKDLILFGVVGGPIKRRVCEYINRHFSVEVDVR